MSRSRECFLIAVTLVTLLVFATTAIAQSRCRDFCLYVPAFEGPEALGRNVATILNLQIWQTFRRSPSPNENELDFGHAGIIWDPNELAVQSHAAAEKELKGWDLLGQMILWGKAYRYGDGVVVQPRLSLPLYDDGRERYYEVWQNDLDNGSIELDLPRRRYELGAIKIPREVVEIYSDPSALTIYSEEFGGYPIGVLGDSYVGVQFHQTERLCVLTALRGGFAFRKLLSVEQR